MILIDAGPLVALVDADDQFHAECSAAFRTLRRQPMGTAWPVLTEVMHFLEDLPKAQDNVWEMIVRGIVEILPLGPDDVTRIRELMQKYSDRPMDLADAALIRVCGTGQRRPPVFHGGSEKLLGLPASRQDPTSHCAVVKLGG